MTSTTGGHKGPHPAPLPARPYGHDAHSPTLSNLQTYPKPDTFWPSARSNKHRHLSATQRRESAMFGQHRWALGLATSTSVLGLTVTSGLVILARRFIEELSRPHELVDAAEFTWQVSSTEPEPPLSCQRPLIFRTSDGTLLCGDFWAQPQRAPTAIICHGYRASRVYLRPAAVVAYNFGYNVLLFDFRGHGESDSVATSGGNAEVRDLQAAITAASQQPETLPGKIIIHGFSMGASVALLTTPHPEVAAIIADSPYARLDQILRQIVRYRLAQESTSWIPPLNRLRSLFPAVAWATVAASTIVFRLRFGHALVARPDMSFKRCRARAKSVLQLHQTPILLIHAAGDEIIPIAHARQLVAKAHAYDVPLETYFVDYAIHCGAYRWNPQRYKAVLQQFLSRHLQHP